MHAASPPVTLKEGKSTVLDNGPVRLEINNDGRLTGLSYRGGPNLAQSGYWNCNANGYDTNGKQIRHRFDVPRGKLRIVRQSKELVEIAFDRNPKFPLPFRASLHYVLQRGEPGFYLYMTLAHDAGMPAGFVVQYAYNLRLNPAEFDYIAVDDTRRHISHSCRDEAEGKAIMDATFRLKNGQVVSKYNYTHAIEDDAFHLYGWAGPRTGVWWIQPSAEYYSSAPFRVLLTSHQTTKSPVLIWQTQCTHRGGYTIDFPPGDKSEWSKLYGPVFVYLNEGKDYDAMWNDAKARVPAQQKSWPYSWMQHELFPVDRGSVSGALTFDNGLPAVNAWVILSPEGIHWSKENRGYHFWTRTDEKGRFRLGKVRPGRYSLFATGTDQFYEFQKDTIEVSANKATDLRTLTWQRVRHGKRIWQIGTADRSTGEFANGNDFHHWGMWRRYPTDFPNDVNFIIGKSKEARDWNYIHWNWYSKRSAWTIKFDLDKKPKGTAVLTFGIAGARGHGSNGLGSRGNASLQVLANGEEVGGVITPSTGGDCYRSQRQSTRYSVKEIRFDASTLRKGWNVIALRHTRATPYKQGEPKGEKGAGPGCIMYDAIRLEIE
jgi:rhamnogalacturonan endolyase